MKISIKTALFVLFSLWVIMGNSCTPINYTGDVAGIRGVVIDTVSRKPQSGVEIELYLVGKKGEDQLISKTTTNSDGYYEIKNISRDPSKDTGAEFVLYALSHNGGFSKLIKVSRGQWNEQNITLDGISQEARENQAIGTWICGWNTLTLSPKGKGELDYVSRWSDDIEAKQLKWRINGDRIVVQVAEEINDIVGEFKGNAIELKNYKITDSEIKEEKRMVFTRSSRRDGILGSWECGFNTITFFEGCKGVYNESNFFWRIVDNSVRIRYENSSVEKNGSINEDTFSFDELLFKKEGSQSNEQEQQLIGTWEYGFNRVTFEKGGTGTYEFAENGYHSVKKEGMRWKVRGNTIYVKLETLREEEGNIVGERIMLFGNVFSRNTSNSQEMKEKLIGEWEFKFNTITFLDGGTGMYEFVEDNEIETRKEKMFWKILDNAVFIRFENLKDARGNVIGERMEIDGNQFVKKSAKVQGERDQLYGNWEYEFNTITLLRGEVGTYEYLKRNDLSKARMIWRAYGNHIIIRYQDNNNS